MATYRLLVAMLDFGEKNDVRPSSFFYIFNMLFWRPFW